jgi:hypothetical protein
MRERDSLSRELSELNKAKLRDPYVLAAKSQLPYEHRTLSKIYQNYSPEKRKKISDETDEQFRRVTGFEGKLVTTKPEHKQLIWTWLRIRDVIMQLKYGEKSDYKKAFRIENQTYKIGPFEVRHDWQSLATIMTTVELQIKSATIVNTKLPYEAARSVQLEEAMSDFRTKVQEEFSSPSIALYSSSDDFIKGVFLLRFIDYEMIISDVKRDKVTKQFKPLLDFTKQGKFNLQWDFKEDKKNKFPEWEMSDANAMLLTEINLRPV